MNDLVSIIMPSYNTGQYISETINTVINQTYSNWELIIVDDCSSDNTDEIIQPYLKDKRINYYKNSKNYGAAISRNRALRSAKGKWIAFLDSDDLWLPQKLELQINFMESNGYSFSYTNYSEISRDGIRNDKTISGPRVISRTGFLNYCWPGCLTVMYDAESIGLIQICDIKKNNDYAMWLKISKTTNCYLLNKNLALYRRGRTNSISNQSIMTLIKWHYKLFRDAENLGVFPSSINTLRNLFFGLFKKMYYVR